MATVHVPGEMSAIGIISGIESLKLSARRARDATQRRFASAVA